MTTKRELSRLAQERLRESRILFKNRRFDGAFYLAGYTVELALKACVCRTLDLTEYPDKGDLSRAFKTHNLDQLLLLSGHQKTFNEEQNKNRELATQWSLVKTWSEEQRYKPVGSNKQKNVGDLLMALGSRKGVFAWLKKRW